MGRGRGQGVLAVLTVSQVTMKLQPGLIARKGQRSLGSCDDPLGCPGLTSWKVWPLHFLTDYVIPVDLRQWPRPSVRATLGLGITASKPLFSSSCKLRPKGYGYIPSDLQGRTGSKMAPSLPSTWDSFCAVVWWFQILLSLSDLQIRSLSKEMPQLGVKVNGI